LNGRSIKDFEDVLKTQKKRHEKEQAEINPRIDEIQLGLDEYAGTDTKGIEGQRDKLKTEIAVLDSKRKKLFATEKERQKNVDYINELTKKQVQREGELANDTSGVKDLLDEKVEIEKELAEKVNAVFQARNNWTAEQTSLALAGNQLAFRLDSLNSVREEYKKTEDFKADDSCFACGQKIPAEKLADNETTKINKLTEIAKRGNDLKAIVDAAKKSNTKQETKLKELSELLTQAEAELQKAQEAKDKLFAEIDKQIEANATTPPESDKAWQIFDRQIKRLEAVIGEPVSEQLQAIDDQRAEKASAIAKLNDALAQADTMKKNKARITELEEKEKELAQKISDVEKQLAVIDHYKVTESRVIEKAVNGKFKHVEFKLFGECLNGSPVECCEATLNGVPYSDMSTGQQIFVGIDIVNVLSEHYNISVPLFIDHTESLTLPIETKTQTIKLFAQANTKTLVVEVEKGALSNV